MDPKPDKECEKRSDIVLLSEIMANSIDWQGIFRSNSVKFRVNFRAYHSINRGSDNSIYHGLMPTYDTIKVALASLR